MNPRQRSRLGRGLGSLIGDTMAATPMAPEQGESATSPGEPSASSQQAAEAEQPATAELQVPVERISRNPHQPRRQFDDAQLADLANSIRSNGVIQPLIVRRVLGNNYQLIAGERRLRAAQMAGLKTVPVVIRDVDQLTQAQMALVENIQRLDLNPIERAEGYRTLLVELGLTQGELAGRLGEDRASIAHHIRLLELPDSLQSMIAEGRLSFGHAKVLGGVADALEQVRLADLIHTQNLSVRNLERIIDQPTPPPASRQDSQTAKPRSAHVIEMERQITRQLGMRAELRTSANKQRGKLVITYRNLDEFDQLMDRLAVDLDLE
jgi:ParB family chromosome partitioning protein